MSEERVSGLPPDDELDLGDEPEELDQADELSEGDDDGGAEPPEEGEETKAEPAQPERRPGRRERQSAELRELRERSERLERELANVRTQSQQPRFDPAEQARRDAQEREQVSMLAPDQQINYWRDRDRRELAQVLHQQQSQIADQIDKTSWDAACARDPRRARLSAEVERSIAAMPPGPARTREVVYKYHLGEMVDRQTQRTSGTQRAAAQRRVRAQTTQPGNGRSDAARERGPAADTVEAARVRISGRPLW